MAKNLIFSLAILATVIFFSAGVILAQSQTNRLAVQTAEGISSQPPCPCQQAGLDCHCTDNGQPCNCGQKCGCSSGCHAKQN